MEDMTANINIKQAYVSQVNILEIIPYIEP